MHSCPYCSDSVDDLVKTANLLARIVNRPQVIGHTAESAAAQYEGASRDLAAINLCLAVRHLAEFPQGSLDGPQG